MENFGWTKSVRAISVILTFGLIFLVIFGEKIPPEQISTLVTFIAGLVIGGYFGKRDAPPEVK